ncbi:hypothetical protein Tco_1206581 [Tanacetum coccineum]
MSWYSSSGIREIELIFDSGWLFLMAEKCLVFIENLESKDSYVSSLDEPALLVTPLFDANEDECFDPGGNFDEIDAFLDIDVPTDIKDGYHDSGGRK